MGCRSFESAPGGRSRIFCFECSQKSEAPVRHVSEVCRIVEGDVVDVIDRSNIVRPDPARIRGPQAGKKSKKKKAGAKRKKKVPVVGKYPCKSQSCAMVHYNAIVWANKHMMKEHPTEGLAPYVEVKRARVRPKKKRRRIPEESESEGKNIPLMNPFPKECQHPSPDE